MSAFEPSIPLYTQKQGWGEQVSGLDRLSRGTYLGVGLERVDNFVGEAELGEQLEGLLSAVLFVHVVSFEHLPEQKIRQR